MTSVIAGTETDEWVSVPARDQSKIATRDKTGIMASLEKKRASQAVKNSRLMRDASNETERAGFTALGLWPMLVALGATAWPTSVAPAYRCCASSVFSSRPLRYLCENPACRRGHKVETERAGFEPAVQGIPHTTV